jgi:dTMP kinase
VRQVIDWPRCEILMASETTKTIRGALVVMEGLDRAGKSSQCQLLHDKLHSMGIPVRLMKFPG